MSMHIGETEVAAGVAEGELFVIETELVEDGGMQVMHVDFAIDGHMADVVGEAVGEAGFEAATGDPDGEAERVVVATGAVFLGIRGAAEFAAPPDDGVFEEAALFEIGEETGDGFIDGGGVVAVFGQVRVLIPGGIVGVVAVIDLDVAHVLLHEAAGHEALATEVVGGFFVDAVKLESGLGLAADVHGIRGLVLHAGGEFVAADDSVDLSVAWHGAGGLLGNLPGMGGLEAAAAIRVGEAGGPMRVPIVALTAGAMQADRDSCLAAGMDDFLAKPYTAAEIDAVIKRWLPDSHARVASAIATQPGPVPAKTHSLALDINVLKGCIGDDDEGVDEFLRSYLDSSAKAAAALHEAHRARRADTISGIGHSLKSTARTVGAIDVGELCAQLEAAGQQADWPTIDAAMQRFDALLAAAAADADEWLAAHST